MKPNFYYITTTAPYVNSKPHIGFASEIVTADVLARYHRQLGEEVCFGTGTDEHGINIYQKALESKINPQAYVDANAQTFIQLKSSLNLSLTHFQRTTNEQHQKAAQAFWQLCDAKGDIYKKQYKIKYCTGCELEKTDSELNAGKCPLHPTKDLEVIDEENYFFRFSNYQQALIDLYESRPDFVVPASKFNEIKAFVKSGLKDFSISRLKSKLPWGVPVPNDSSHVMYVWFDALVFYISTLGWPDSSNDYKNYWPGIQIAGKDNLRQQTAMWQAMLMSAGLENSIQILINGFINVDGQKMSKTLGNVISPNEILERYSLDSTRYLLMNLGPILDDVDVSWSKFDARYHSDLVNGLGNTVHRVATLCEKSGLNFAADNPPGFRSQVKDQFSKYRLDLALEEVWKSLSDIDKSIQTTQPWTLSGKPLQSILQTLVARLRQVAYEIQPFMPDTATQMTEIFKGPKISKPASPLFPRLIKESL